MEKRDYLMREIEKIGAMLRMLIRRRIEQKDQQDEQDYFGQVDDSLQDEFGINMETLTNYTENELVGFIEKIPGLNLENISLLGDLLVDISEIDLENEQKLLKLALATYLHVTQNSDTFDMGLANNISLIKEKLEKNQQSEDRK